MKKFSLGIVAMASLMLASCGMDVKDSTSKDRYVGFNLINPLDNSAPLANGSFYTVDLNITKMNGTVNTAFTYKDAKYEFTSDDQSVIQEYGANVFKNFKGDVNEMSTLPLSNANLLFTYNFVYPYNQFQDPDNKTNTFTLNQFYPNKENQAVGGTAVDGVLYTPINGAAPIVVGSYLVGNEFKVTTFTTDRTYSGITSTHYKVQGQDTGATSKTIYYRVILDIKESKAYVVMYKAKFSNVQAEPEKAVIYLEGLDLTWGNGTYSISGSNIVPKVVDGGKLEENPDFTFESFNMQAQGQYMTDAVMNFKVINSMMGHQIEYSGNFSGQSVVIPDSMK